MTKRPRAIRCDAEGVVCCTPDGPKGGMAYHALNCDVLLWRPTSWYGHLIARGTDGPYSHASIILWWDDMVMSVGFEEGRGGVVEPLRNLVRRYPGVISAFRVTDSDTWTIRRKRIVRQELLRSLSGSYQWANIRLLALMCFPFAKLFLFRMIQKRIERASHHTAGGICSQYVARAYKEAGYILMRKPPAITTPNDLATSPLLECQGVLYPKPLPEAPIV